jgi:TatD DNase family protein
MVVVAKQCQEHNIKMLSVSMCISSYNHTVQLSKKYTFIIPSFGIHPWKASKCCDNLLILDKFLDECKYIGEIGLDKKFLKYASKYSDQQKIFDYIASSKFVDNKFLNLHTSGAESDVLSTLEKYGRNKFIVHWYAGDLDTMDKYLSMGGYFTIGVEVLFNKHIQEIAKKVPLDRVLVETDNPSSYSWLGGHHTSDGMPVLLFRVVEKICQLKNIDKSSLYKYLLVNQNIILGV